MHIYIYRYVHVHIRACIDKLSFDVASADLDTLDCMIGLDDLAARDRCNLQSTASACGRRSKSWGLTTQKWILTTVPSNP